MEVRILSRALKSKVCVRCKKRRVIEQFTKNTTKKGGRNPACRICHSKWQKKHYKKNPEYYKKKAREYGRKLKALIVEAKSRPCQDCGHSYPPYVMDFDHRDGAQKEFNLSLGWQTGLRRVRAEMAKCDIVCSNCHRERTHRRHA